MSVRVRSRAVRRGRARLTGVVLLLVVVVAAISTQSGSIAPPPHAGSALGAAPGDPFAYRSAREADFVARATAGEAHVLFTQSPGGALATAQRVAGYRSLIDRAAAGSGLDPNLIEALVFVESAGRPEVIAGSDPSDAAGLTQILASTGQSLLGMNIDLARSRTLTREIDAVAAGTRRGRLAPLARPARRRRSALQPVRRARGHSPLPGGCAAPVRP